MDLHLRSALSHPKSRQRRAVYALSTKYPRIVTAASDLLVDFDTSTSAIRSTIRTTGPIDRIAYVGGARTFIVFLENGTILSYVENYTELRRSYERKIGGDGRTVTLAKGSAFGSHALYVKTDSPSLWCLSVGSNGELNEPFKLRSDIEGDQQNVNFIDGMFAKVRGRVATAAKARACPIASIAIHPSFPIATAAYTNGILRVWDIRKKEQRIVFDAQLLLGEKVVQVDLHPHMPLVALCTTHGRVLTFNIKSTVFKRGEEPALASSKMRDRKRIFSAMCFTLGSPSYLLLLTVSKKILVRMVSKASMIVNSSIYSKPARLTVPADDFFFEKESLMKESSTSSKSVSGFSIQWDPVVGFLTCTTDMTGSVYVFQRIVDGLPAIKRPITNGLDTGFSESSEDPLAGPVLVPPDVLVAQNNALFSYQLGSERTDALATLPPGDIRRLEVARDEHGRCIGCLVFYSGDDEIDTRSYAEKEHPLRYVLCTKRGDDDAWNVSEPSEGRSGCFLGASGVHDRILILGNSGSVASLFSFAGISSRDGQRVRQSRGVQRYKLIGNRAVKVFRTPFASWSAILYHDIDGRRLAMSRNASENTRSDDTGSSFAMDEQMALDLSEGEIVLDVRWQLMKESSRNTYYFGAVMTNKRIYFVRNALQLCSTFQFQRIMRMVVPLAPPSVCWIGPSLVLIYGQALFSISVDGTYDLIAGLSRSKNISAVVAALPSRIVYIVPSSDQGVDSLSIVSRPISSLSGLARGVMALRNIEGNDRSRNAETIRRLLETHDVSQTSLELSSALIKNNLAPSAYCIANSQQGYYGLPSLGRAALLGRLGDIRGAVRIVETEYSRLLGGDLIHEGKELFRFLQRILNIAFVARDYASCRRCSRLLGRKGTFAAFIDCEGGHAAVTSLVETARTERRQYIFQIMRPVIDKSASSSIATTLRSNDALGLDEGRQKVIRLPKVAPITLGSTEKSRVFVIMADNENESKESPSFTQMELPPIPIMEISDRLEVYRNDCDVKRLGTESQVATLDSDFIASGAGVSVMEKPELGLSGDNDSDHSNEDELFDTGGEIPRPVAQGTASSIDKIDRTPGIPYVPQTATIPNDPQRESARIINEQAKQTQALMLLQQQPLLAGQPVPKTRAREIQDRAVGKYDQGRFTSAQKELDMALRSIGRGNQRGVTPSQEPINEVVFYQMACRLRIAMDEIASSTHANTVAGRMTYGQLAVALSRLPLIASHRVQALILAADAHLLLNNFGSAAEALKIVKELGVPENMRSSLRDKYSVCAAKGFHDFVSVPSTAICFKTLKSIGMNRTIRCSLCPAVFSSDSDVGPGSCPCCGIGSVRLV